MSMHDRLDVWPSVKDGSVEWILRRRPMRAIDSSVGLHTDDVVASQAAFIDPSRRDPHITIVIANRKVSAGRRRHAIAINAIHRLHNGITWMNEIALRHLNRLRSSCEQGHIIRFDDWWSVIEKVSMALGTEDKSLSGQWVKSWNRNLR